MSQQITLKGQMMTAPLQVYWVLGETCPGSRGSQSPCDRNWVDFTCGTPCPAFACPLPQTFPIPMFPVHFVRATPPQAGTGPHTTGRPILKHGPMSLTVFANLGLCADLNSITTMSQVCIVFPI